MPYSHVSWSQLKAMLLARLGDSVFWSDAEAGIYLAEALRVWQAAANFWKSRAHFKLTPNVPWHDLSAKIAALAYTITDQDLLTEIEYHLLEPISPNSWIGSDQFTLDDVQGAIERRRDQFLYESGAKLQVETFPAVGPALGRFEIPIDPGARPIVDVRRVAWTGSASGVSTQLWRCDEWEANSFLLGWAQNPATPQAYSVAATPPFTIQLIPPPSDSGLVEVLSVPNGLPLDVTTGVALGIPDNFAWVIKYGALADLLGKQGPAHDGPRAAYAERRFRDGVELARMYSQVLFVQVLGEAVPVPALEQADAFSPGWQNGAAGPPKVAPLAGFNLIAFSPPPDIDYTVTADVLTAAPVPSSNGEKVQIGPEITDAILDHAEHVGSFKQGGEEFEGTTEKYENLLRLAAVHNEKLRASAKFASVIRNRALQEERQRPRRSLVKFNA